MPIIALQGIRGGVGTTTVTAGLAWALQNLGERVLVIDFSSDNLLRLHFNTAFLHTQGWARAFLDNLPWQKNAMRYTTLLDFLPFGHTTALERALLETQLDTQLNYWQENIAQLNSIQHYQWILLNLPAGISSLTLQGQSLADKNICVLNSDTSCHVRLHQHQIAKKCYFLVNKYNSAHQLQRDLLSIWHETLPELIPITIHYDAAVAEAFAAKQPPGEYSTQSLATKELNQVANWCLDQYVLASP